MKGKQKNKSVGAGPVSAQSQQRHTQNNVGAGPVSAQQNAITLISLVITIIILLILAGVTINLVFGENGIFKIAEDAGEKHKIEQIKEQVEIALLNEKAKKIKNGETLTVEQALIELNANETFSEIDQIEQTGTKEGYVITLGYNESGEVIIKDLQKDLGVRLIVNQEPKGYTNGKVTLTIKISNSGENISNIEVPVGITKKAEGTYEIEKNGTYKIKATLSSGQVLEKEITIQTIDKLAPKDFGITAKYETNKLKITAEAQDEETSEDGSSIKSGIKYYEYYVIDSKGVETKYNKNEIENLGRGEYKIYAIAYDNAGNHKKSEEITFTISLKFSQIAGGSSHSLGIDTEGNLWAWGSNGNGELGDGTETNRTTPVQIKAGTKFSQISVGYCCTLGIDKEGNLWAWGYNGHGQLGDGTTTDRTTPVQIKVGTKFSQISAGKWHSLGIDTEGNLWAWGRNGNGQLGDETTTDRHTPVQIKVGTKFSQISVGECYSLGIDAEGNLWAWGENNQGQLGDGTTTTRTTPVQIKAGTKFSQIGAGKWHSLGIDTEGNLWAWGENNQGQLGDGTTTTRTTPVQIKAGTKFSQIAGGEYHSLGIDTEGNLWAWGRNGGRLGDGIGTDRDTPVQIKAGTKFSQIAGGYDHSLGIDKEGNLWTWGNNYSGQLGDETTTERYTPVQIK